jgi:hypothetical protein
MQMDAPQAGPTIVRLLGEDFDGAYDDMPVKTAIAAA